jgi:hypothetical protein
VIAPMRTMYRLVGAFYGLLVGKREGHREKVEKTLLGCSRSMVWGLEVFVYVMIE